MFFTVACFFESLGIHHPGHYGTENIEICDIGNGDGLKVDWLPFNLKTSNFRSKRSNLKCDPPGQENPHDEPGTEMLTTLGLAGVSASNLGISFS